MELRPMAEGEIWAAAAARSAIAARAPGLDPIEKEPPVGVPSDIPVLDLAGESDGVEVEGTTDHV